MFLIDTDIDQDANDNEDDDSDYLQRSKPVFHFAIRFHVDCIDANEEDPENKTDDPGVPCCPILKDKLSGCKIRRN